MRILAIAALISIQPLAAQPRADTACIRAELTALHAELNQARKARDPAALERIFAPEFRWIHGVGYADDRARQIETILQADSDEDLPPPSFDPPNELLVLGDTIVLRRPAFVAAGGVRLYSTHIFVRRNGRWQILQMQGTPLLPERRWITLTETALDALGGTYGYGSGAVASLRRVGSALERRVAGFPHRTLRPVAPNLFYDDIGTEYRFERGTDGRVTGFTSRMATGREGVAKRIE